jgi:DNA-directed RNA polymerase specialized sigma54-like protein
MTMATKREGPLALAAMAFETELSRYEEISDETARGPLTSEKALIRAKKQLEESAACQVRLAEHLKAVVAALDVVRGRQEACAQNVMTAAHRVQTRAEEHLAMIQRFSALGLRARDVNEPVASVVARKAEGAPARELLAGLREVLAQTEAIVVDAEALARDAASADWTDVARAAESLKDQVQSARNRVLLAEKSLTAQTPS